MPTVPAHLWAPSQGLCHGGGGVEKGKGDCPKHSAKLQSQDTGCRSAESGLQQSLAGIRLGAQSDAVMGGRGPRGEAAGGGAEEMGEGPTLDSDFCSGCEDTLPRALQVVVEGELRPPPWLVLKTYGGEVWA